MREKLIEVLEALFVDYGAAAIFFTKGEAEVIADHLIANGVTIPVRCMGCKHGIWDEDEGLYRCVYDAEFDEKYGEYFGFVEYNEGEHFCSYGERRMTDG